MRELLMGNEAMAMGAMVAGVKLVCGYPGTPSSEVLETVAARKPEGIYVEWSINEKTAIEVTAGAAYAGNRALVTMKQVGLNVASDPLMCVNYVGIKGGMVVLVADDPGPISSQTEQDTRHFGKYAGIPVFDPQTPEQAYEMIQDAFALSEELGRPVIFRPTTRVCHGCASIDVEPAIEPKTAKGFVKDSRWVIFPGLSHDAKKKIFERQDMLSLKSSEYRYNEITGSGKIGIACGGGSAAYTRDAVNSMGIECRLFSVGMPYPFPEKKALEFLRGLEKVIVFEELDPVIEDALIYVCGKNKVFVEICGKHTGHTIYAGENSQSIIEKQLEDFLGKTSSVSAKPDSSCQCSDSCCNSPKIPARPPILCAGCPHRSAFYAVKQAMKGRKAVFCGDIGCYTLGNAMPIDMVDTCLCMGAAISVPQGMMHADNDAVHFGFVGDSTFFHSGITNIINGVYNQADMIAVVLDNSTTAMTGHQPHPGMGRTMMGEISACVSIEKILEAVGTASVRVVDPLNLKASIEAVQAATEENGVRCIIFRSPCVALFKADRCDVVDADKCVGCLRCIDELGCPALSVVGDKVEIEAALCTGCGLCRQICPASAIEEVSK